MDCRLDVLEVMVVDSLLEVAQVVVMACYSF